MEMGMLGNENEDEFTFHQFVEANTTKIYSICMIKKRKMKIFCELDGMENTNKNTIAQDIFNQASSFTAKNIQIESLHKATNTSVLKHLYDSCKHAHLERLRVDKSANKIIYNKGQVTVG